MMKFLLSKHSRSIFIFALLSLFMCMAAGKASAAELNPVVKIDKTSYTSSGTEVTLRLWMFNNFFAIGATDFCARFTGDVNLYIDDKEVVRLNNIWSSIADAKRTDISMGSTGNSTDIKLDGINVGTALFNNLQYSQTCPDNSDPTEKSWYTVDLKLSFNKSFSYYGHKITVKGKWQDQSSGSVVSKDVALDNIINGFVRPVNLSAQPSGDNIVFSWKQEGYNNDASTLGKMIVYKSEDGNNVKLGEVAANEHSLSIDKKQYSCSKDYIMTFLPNVYEGEETVCGLTTTFIASEHQINDDDVCQYCNHSFFRYTTSDGKIVNNIKNKEQFGANIVAHSVVDGKFVIEFDGPITKIPEKAFYNRINLTGDFVIPNSVTEIGAYAFFNCTGLNGTLKLSSKLKKICDSAFNRSGFTGTLKLPNSLTDIGGSAFQSCKYFTSLELSNTLNVISKFAFNGCEGLSGSLVIPNSVTEIGAFAFSGCTGFNGTLTLSSKLETIGNSAFNGCKGFTGSLKLPSSLTYIGIAVFMGCKCFTSLELPNTQSVIPKSTFKGCEGLSGSLVIPNSVTEIGERAFQNCTGFNGTLTLSSKLETIGNSAFNGCKGFTGTLTLPNSVIEIGEQAFQNCTGFNGTLTLSSKLETIGNSAFNGCKGFTGTLTLPNSVTTIEQSAFMCCDGFTKLELPNTLSVIPNNVFLDCSSLSGELVIPASVTEIGRSAFNGCKNLNAVTRQVTLPKSLKKIGIDVFRNAYNINTVNFQSLPEGISENLVNKKIAVSLSDDSYISDMASGTVNEISYTRTMTSNWGTLVLPYPLKLTGEEPYRLYAIDNMTGEELVLKQLNGEVAAGTPCVVKRKGSEAELTFSANNAELNMAINDQPMDGMKFSGTYWTKDVDNGYIIAKDCFWNVEKLKGVDSVTAVKVGPFRAWLDGTSPNGASQLSICVSDTATGIGAAGTIDALNDTATEYYDLSGKRLDEPQKGVNIVRMKSGKTKKIIIK